MDTQIVRAVIASLLLAAGGACVAAGTSPWMMDKLKTHAAFDMQCTEDQLTTTETGTWTYGVRGCNKQAVYIMQACNRMTKQCTFLRNSEVQELEPQTAPATVEPPGNSPNDAATSEPVADPAGDAT